MIWFCIFIVTFFITYGILFYHLVKERNKRYSLMKEYQKLKCEYDSQSKDSYVYFSNAEKERNAKHENVIRNTDWNVSSVIFLPKTFSITFQITMLKLKRFDVSLLD